MAEQQENRQIIGKTKSVNELLNNAKYAIDYYQREYRWQEKHITELIDDLTGCFLEEYDENHSRKEVANYKPYFLGSIIISQKNGSRFIIDGQQRLTSITLLLIYLNNMQKNNPNKSKASDLIYSEKYGEKSFNIDVEERQNIMSSLYEDSKIDDSSESESIQNILNRYEDIKENWPQEITNEILPFFIDWLKENVYLVEITAFNDEDAYTIFETMNDRGLSLAPTEMLKGYLLSNISDADKRNRSNKKWKDIIKCLNEIGKEEDADCIKAWLRSQYAQNIRERKRGALPQDFDRIGTEFHRWVRDNQDLIKLEKSDKFAEFIDKQFMFYAIWYTKLREASIQLTKGFEHVFYIAQTRFTQHYQVLLAPIMINDDEELIKQKIKLVAIYLDIFLHRRMWNYHSLGYSVLSYTMFQLMLSIRDKSLSELTSILKNKLDEEKDTFAHSEKPFKLHGMNRTHVKNLLARMTSYVEEKSAMDSNYETYVTNKGKKRYEVEHIWADHPERHKKEFSSDSDFQDYRNLIGGLLLLPRQFNDSYNDLPYDKKLPLYDSQNILARSLNPNAYKHNPGFIRFIESSNLNFEPYPDFEKKQLLTRQKLYEQLAERVWNTEQLMDISIESGSEIN